MDTLRRMVYAVPDDEPVDYILGGNVHRGMGAYLVCKAIVPFVPMPLLFTPIFGFLFAVICANMEGGRRRQWSPQARRVACTLVPFDLCALVPVPGFEFGPSFPATWHGRLQPYDMMYRIARPFLATAAPVVLERL